MISRYQDNPNKKTIDGREVYQSKIYPNIELRDTDLYVATETGDRLDTLAYQFYNDSSLWWIIASANNIHNAPIGLQEGTVLRIPEAYISIIRDFKNNEL
jgi:hypothetical protein